MPDRVTKRLMRGQRVLSLFTAPARAENLIGDFAEQRLSGMRFWTHVLGTAAALGVQQIRSSPARLLTTAAAAFLIAQIVISGIIPMSLLHGMTGSVGALPLLLLITGFNVLALVLIGLAGARLNPAREMTACGIVATGALATACVGLGLAIGGHGSALITHFIQWNLFAAFLLSLPGLAIRSRNLTAGE